MPDPHREIVLTAWVNFTSTMWTRRTGEGSAEGARVPAVATARNAAPEAPAPPARSALTAEERQRLVGWWLRYDQSYMIEIESVGEDGRLAARYLNPDPVGVSKA
jgi:hypothetical protein